MKIFNKHKHNFVKESNQLWCKCGEIRDLKCNHKWIVHKEQLIANHINNKQLVQILICKKCGEFKILNTTTGEYK